MAQGSKRRKCPTCGSKQWHKEPSSGLIACSEGHILQNYRNETTEIQEMGPHAMKKRTIKSRREKKGKRSRGDAKLYHGARARTHYFLCLQLILRKQIVVLKRLWDLPDEFEVICKDLWTLYLSSLTEPLPDPEGMEGRDDEREKVREREDKKGKGRGTDGKDEEEGEDSQEEGEEEEVDSELEALMRENSDFSSSENSSSEDSESESDSGSDEDEDEDGEVEDGKSGSGSEEDDGDNEDEDEATPKKTKRKRQDGTKTKRKRNSKSKSKSKMKRRKKGIPPSESSLCTLSILVVSCWILRVPVLYMDFITLINSYTLPYLSPLLPSTNPVLPQSLSQHLNKHTLHALSPAFPPGVLQMHKAAGKFVKKVLCDRFTGEGLEVPEWNAAGGMWRVVKGMGGGPVLYALTKRTLSFLSMPFRLHSILAPGLAQFRKGDPLGHRYDNAPPEVQVWTGVVVVLKMVYGLDGVPRTPKDAADPACGLPDLESYFKILDQMAEKEKTVREPWDTLELDDDEDLDAYMGFCERALVGGKPVDSAGVLDGYFPLVGGEPVASDGECEDRGVSFQGVTGIQSGKTGDEVEPGSEYKMYTSSEVGGEIARILSRGSCLLGVPPEYLSAVLLSTERKLRVK